MPLVYCNLEGRSFHISFDETLKRYVIDEVQHDVI